MERSIMKVEVKKVDALKREMKFVIPREKVTEAMDAVYSEIGKHAKIKGFRPGKVPRHILVTSHGQLAKDETIKKIIPKAYHEGVNQHQLNPIDLPEISEVDLKDGVLTFTATLDIRPEVEIKNYKGIKVERKKSEVTDEEVQKTLEFFKKGRAEEEVTIDDNFAKGMGFPSLEEFKKALKHQLESDKDRNNRMDIENQIVEDLIKNAKLIVPQSLVKRQLHYRLNEAVKRLKSQGLNEEELKKKEEELRGQLEPAVEREVRIYLILEEIAKLENIIITDQNDSLPGKVIELLMKEANWQDAK
jgi:FKBP-type peptidyl-prolyl cis-trans isomerase (trigger factor)